MQGGLPADGAVLTFNAISNQWEFAIAGGGSMGDLEFLAQKQKDGDLIHATGSVVNTGQVCAIIPALGKTFFIAKATFAGVAVDALGDLKFSLENDGVVVDNLVVTVVQALFQESAIQGDSLVGDGVKEYSIEYLESSGSTRGSATLIGWIEDT